LEQVRELRPDVRLIVVTGARDERVAAAAMKLGAVDYVPKDELLTSGIFRSLQGALREREEAREGERRAFLSTDRDRLHAAEAEVDWLLDALRPEAEFAPAGTQEGRVSAPRDRDWSDLVEAFLRYMTESMRRFPQPALKQEYALVRKFMERGASPREVVLAYDAALRSKLSEGDEPSLSPSICLARVLARLVERYQVQVSLAQLAPEGG
jgi:hypothetical protein